MGYQSVSRHPGLPSFCCSRRSWGNKSNDARSNVCPESVYVRRRRYVMDRRAQMQESGGSMAQRMLGTRAPIPRDRASREVIAQEFEALSNWGRWGRDDELGALNLITPEKRRAAAILVREGITISLSHDAVEHRVGVSAPFQHTMIESSETPGAESAADIYSVQYHGYTQTHLDALCHVFHGDWLYNGFPKTKVTMRGAECL